MGMAALWGYALQGMDAVPVRVEAHVRPGLPGVTIVGLPGTAVREARERVRSGASSSGLPLPTQRITVNLSPVELRKESSGFDLPVALAVLAASGHFSPASLRGVGAVGELALDGLVRPVRGVLAMAEAARGNGTELLIVPLPALPEAAEAGEVPTVGVRSLGEAVAVLKDGELKKRLKERGNRWLRLRIARFPEPPSFGVDLADIAGHHHGKRALEVAAAGAHSMLMVGPPGAGKTMLARRLPSILPSLTREEALEVTRVWSVAGLRHTEDGLASERPFRAPHHTASRSALVGGGPAPRPGEVSLAHRGVLFLDEFPEFSRDALEALRQPLDDGHVLISRRSWSCVFPARCTLVAAMNPCPCGFLGHPTRACRCSPAQVQGYRSQLSGPLLDRIDLMLEIAPLTTHMLEENPAEEEPSIRVRERVIRAREFRMARERPRSDGSTFDYRSAHPSVLEERSGLSREARVLLHEAVARQALGGRGYVRSLRVARTLADLDGAASIYAEHVAEAFSLRLSPQLDEEYWTA